MYDFDIKTNKRDHPINITYICNDCTFVFTIHSKTRQGKRPFCPNCGDSVSVNRFEKAEKVKKVWKPWTDKEFELVDRIIDGELLKYQVAAQIGRTYGAVQRKVEQRRKERGVF